MNEEFLEFLWINRLYFLPLETSSGEPVYVMNPGIVNRDGGPDLFNAIIRLDKTIWAGNIELHVRSSDWFLHGHHKDESYDNVILHVVHQHDTDVKSTTGTEIPCVELRGRYDPKLFSTYNELKSQAKTIPCSKFLNDISSVLIKDQIQLAFLGKIARKKDILAAYYSYYEHHLERAFFTFLFRSFGFRVNALPFELLSKSFDHRLIMKYQDHPGIIEAILFGQAGLLPDDHSDDYVKKLKEDHAFVAKKYHLDPIDGSLWKFLRMRPAGFPTIRIAQLSALLSHVRGIYRIFSDIGLGPDEFHSYLSVPAHPFWEGHYTFDRASRKYSKSIGKGSACLIFIDFLLPFQLFQHEMRGQEFDLEKRIQLLKQFPPENNMVTRKFAESGIEASNLLESTGMTELKSHVCDKKRCLGCKVGKNIVGRKMGAGD